MRSLCGITIAAVLAGVGFNRLMAKGMLIANAKITKFLAIGGVLRKIGLQIGHLYGISLIPPGDMEEMREMLE